MKFYEIIQVGWVTGVCFEDGCEHAFKESGNGCTFGRITKKEFQSYGDNPWEDPISKVRYNPKYIFTMGCPHC